MKYAKKKKKQPIFLYVLLAVAVLILAVTVFAAVKFSNQDPTDPGMETEGTGIHQTTATPTTHGSANTEIPETTEAAETTEATDATEATDGIEATEPSSGKETEPVKKEDYSTIKTPYGTLKFPKEWAGFLRVTIKEGNVYTLTYFADLESGKSQELFSISFGGSMDGAVGTVTVGGKKVPVSVKTVEFKPDASWSQKEINIVYTMQEAMNQVLDSLSVEYITNTPEDQPDLPQDNGEEMVIDTPYAELRYPSRWKDYLDLKFNDKNGYSVEFRCKIEGHDPVVLFIVHFGGDQGIPVGTGKDNSGKDVEIRLEVPEQNLDNSWSDEHKRIVTAMQEDLNVLLSKLK